MEENQKGCDKAETESTLGYIIRMQKNIHDILYVVPDHSEGEKTRFYLLGMYDAFRNLEKKLRQ